MTNGFYLVATPDRFEELKKFINSLRKHHREPIQVMIALDKVQAHEFKTMCGSLTTFDKTIMMDIDMLVLRNFGEIFSCLGSFDIALHDEPKWGTYNSGFIAFNKYFMKEVSKLWHENYLKRNFEQRPNWKGIFEQDLLTDILKRRKEIKISKHQIYNLPKFYNYCIYRYTAEEELEDWDHIKVLHFWTGSNNKPDPERKSWKLWKGGK